MSHPTKLTLRLDSGLIDHAKDFAQRQDRSLSQLVADYFARLTAQEATPVETERSAQSPGTAPSLGPITSALRGALAASGAHGKTPESPPGREDYRAYLEDKFR
jgi:hypothetical protein